jgi:hypothetical protein
MCLAMGFINHHWPENCPVSVSFELSTPWHASTPPSLSQPWFLCEALRLCLFAISFPSLIQPIPQSHCHIIQRWYRVCWLYRLLPELLTHVPFSHQTQLHFHPAMLKLNVLLPCFRSHICVSHLLQHHQHPSFLLNLVLAQFNRGGNGSITVFGLGISCAPDLSRWLLV